MLACKKLADYTDFFFSPYDLKKNDDIILSYSEFNKKQKEKAR